MAAELEFTVEGRVAWLTINRPQARNALNEAVRTGIREHLEAFEADPGLAVLVLTGAGDKAFCAGADLKEMSERQMTVPPPDFIPIPGLTLEVSKPIIAAVNGDALAGGFLLAQGCDLCVAADHARFAISEVKVGRGAPWAVPLPWLMPPRVAMELLLTGDPIDAERARELGFVNRVVPKDELRPAVQQLAERIAGNAPLSVRAAKRTVHLAAEAGVAEAFRSAQQLWEPVYLSSDAQEGPRAFREKRAPQWTGT